MLARAKIPASKIILLVEDNLDDEHITLRALRRNNVMNEVVVAIDGAQALDYLFGTGPYAGRDTGQMPSLIILDLKLPGMSGLDVLKRIRSTESTQFIPVAVLTSSSEDLKVKESYSNGANTFIVKPTDPQEYSEMVLQVAMYWLLLNRAAPQGQLL